MNNYLRYCLPISIDVLSEDAHTALRDHYFGELKRLGMQKKPEESTREEVLERLGACASFLQEAQESLDGHCRLFERVIDNPSAVEFNDLNTLLEEFDKLSRLAKAYSSIPDDEKTSFSIQGLKSCASSLQSKP